MNRIVSKQQAFFTKHPEMAELLGATYRHRILADMKDRFSQFGDLSDRQVEFFKKLADEEKSRAAEPMAAAPVGKGRKSIKGAIVSRKLHEGQFGVSVKITVRVETPEGTWLAWGTMPASLDDSGSEWDGSFVPGADVGDVVSFSAGLEAGSAPHFAFFKRPTQAAFVARGERATSRLEAVNARRQAAVEAAPSEDPFAVFANA